MLISFVALRRLDNLIPGRYCFNVAAAEAGSKPIKSLFEDGQLGLANSHYRGDTRTCTPLIESFRQRFNFPASGNKFDARVWDNRGNAPWASSFRRCLATIPVPGSSRKNRKQFAGERSRCPRALLRSRLDFLPRAASRTEPR